MQNQCTCENPEPGTVCPTGGWIIGGHNYNIHITQFTFKCACGAVMGRSNSHAPAGINPFGGCPLMNSVPLPGEIYQKHNGDQLKVVAIAKHTETGQALVIYHGSGACGRDDKRWCWARPLSTWHEWLKSGEGIGASLIVSARVSCDPPKPFEVYRHYKGGRYEVVIIAKHTETGQDLVIYHGSGAWGPAREYCWARPLSMWCGQVKREDGTSVPRFVRSVPSAGGDYKAFRELFDEGIKSCMESPSPVQTTPHADDVLEKAVAVIVERAKAHEATYDHAMQSGHIGTAEDVMTRASEAWKCARELEKLKSAPKSSTEPAHAPPAPPAPIEQEIREQGYHAAEVHAQAQKPQPPLKVGDRVEKFTGDYQLEGEVRAVFTTRAGKTRYVVEHDPGFLHIYSRENLRPVSK